MVIIGLFGLMSSFWIVALHIGTQGAIAGAILVTFACAAVAAINFILEKLNR